MIVADFMQHNPVTLPEDRPVRDVVRLIFNLGVSAVLITREKKLIGITTEEDILQKLFPSVKDFMEDFVHAHSFEFVEERLPELLKRPAKTIMTSPVVSVTKDVPIMKALSTMFVKNFSHMPVVNETDEILGIISQGDIFRALASSEIPFDTGEEYHDWVSRHFDLIQGSMKRYETEVSNLLPVFKKNKVKKIVNIGSGTGSHDIMLAQNEFEIYSIEKSKRMHLTAVQKKSVLPALVQNRLQFEHGESYTKLLSAKPRTFDAALFMGNSLSHISVGYEEVLKTVSHSLKETNAVLVLEISNIEKVFTTGRRLRNFTVSPSRLTKKREYSFLEFYDPERENNKLLTLNMAIFAHNGRRWAFRGINSTPIAPLTPQNIDPLLKKLGFKSVTLYGSRYGEPILDRKPDYQNDDWITIVAVR